MDYPFDKTWWVDNGRILAGQFPGDIDPEKELLKLKALLDAGVTTFVNLQREDDTAYGKPFSDYMKLLEPLANERGLRLGFCRFPIRDAGLTDTSTMIDILDHIDDHIETDQKPYVHCWGGNGRTGTVIGCWLVRHGRIPEEAIEEMKRGREGRKFSKSAPENDIQRKFIKEWPKYDPKLKR